MRLEFSADALREPIAEQPVSDQPIPEDIQRFILMNIESVAKIEALLLMRSQPEQAWDAELLARRLYIAPRDTEQILADLSELGLCQARDEQGGYFSYQPASPELKGLIDRLAEAYSRYLIPITNLIHQRSAPKRSAAQQFADAFKLRKDKEGQ